MNDIHPFIESALQRLAAASYEKRKVRATYAQASNEFDADQLHFGFVPTRKLPISAPPTLLGLYRAVAFKARGAASGPSFQSLLESCGKAVQTKLGSRKGSELSAAISTPMKSTPNLWGTHNA